MRNTAPILIACITTLGCAREAPLEATGPAAVGEDTAIVEVEGATIKAEVDAWPGNRGILDEVTPVRLTIVNESDQPVSLQYRYLQLVGDNRTYPALPPMKIEGEIVRYDPIPEPLFYHEGFFAAPYYGGVYPGVPIYPGPFAYDPIYYPKYYEEWGTVELPTAEMVLRALPEGVLEPGGSVIGFVYFKAIDPDAFGRIKLRATLVNAKDETVIGTATVPFATPDEAG